MQTSAISPRKVTTDGAADPIRYGDEYGANVIGAAIEASNGVTIPIDALPVPVFRETTPSSVSP